jgi:HD-like signal output (HDOD) protein
MKLANSAHFGMSGRVTSLQLAIAVVGFTTVRTLATVTLTDSTDETELPDDFWDVGTGIALAASALAPRFGEYAPDALCLGLLSQVGAALLHHHDPAGYRWLVDQTPDFTPRRAAEQRRYGLSSIQLSAAALERWGFHESMTFPMLRLDDRTSPRGALLRAALEVVARLTVPDHEFLPIGAITCSTLREDDLSPVVHDVRGSLASLRGMFSDD